MIGIDYGFGADMLVSMGIVRVDYAFGKDC